MFRREPLIRKYAARKVHQNSDRIPSSTLHYTRIKTVPSTEETEEGFDQLIHLLKSFTGLVVIMGAQKKGNIK